MGPKKTLLLVTFAAATFNAMSTASVTFSNVTFSVAYYAPLTFSTTAFDTATFIADASVTTISESKNGLSP